jgi:glyoxylase-like metal-dependent hydrolase (beta-lactamase superfamily II)
MLYRDVADGVHRIGEYFVNWYLVEENGHLALIDAGLPASWRSLLGALNAIGRAPGDIEALVLTHAHFDHIGFAKRARAELGIPVWVHENDAPLTHRPWLYMTERSPLSYLEAVMNSIRNGLGMRETEIAKEPSRPWNPHSYAVFAQVHNTL